MKRLLLSFLLLFIFSSCSTDPHQRKCCLEDCTGMWVVVGDKWYNTRCYRIKERVDSVGYEVNINLKTGKDIIVHTDILPKIEYR